MEILRIKKGNEIFVVNQNNETGEIFLVFGATDGNVSNLYEMSLTKEDVSFLSKCFGEPVLISVHEINMELNKKAPLRGKKI